MSIFKILALLSFSFILFSCSENVSSDCGCDDKPDTKMKATFTDIQDKLFTTTCATSGCHADFQKPILSKGLAYANIVGVNNLAGTMQIVKPGDSQNSFLIKKLLGEGTTRMPSGGDRLDQAIIDSVAAWIDNGALNN